MKAILTAAELMDWRTRSNIGIVPSEQLVYQRLGRWLKQHNIDPNKKYDKWYDANQDVFVFTQDEATNEKSNYDYQLK